MSPFVSVLTARTLLTSDTALYTFSVAGGEITYKPGQFVTLLLSQPGAERPVPRTYSIAGTPGGIFNPQTVTTPSYTLFIKHVEGGKGTGLLQNLPLGAELKTLGPAGVLTLDSTLNTSTTLVFCANATGIAPFLSMLQHFAFRATFYNIKVLWGLRTMQDVCFVESFSAYESLWKNNGSSLTITYFLSRQQMTEGQNAHIMLGRIQSGLPALSLEGHPAYAFYICGGKEFVIDVKNTLLALFPHSPVATERFN